MDYEKDIEDMLKLAKKPKSRFDKWLNNRTLPEIFGIIAVEIVAIIFMLILIVRVSSGIVMEVKGLFQTEQIEEVLEQTPLWR